MHTLTRTFTDKHAHEDNTRGLVTPLTYTKSHIHGLIYSEPVLVTLGTTVVVEQPDLRIKYRSPGYGGGSQPQPGR